MTIKRALLSMLVLTACEPGARDTGWVLRGQPASIEDAARAYHVHIHADDCDGEVLFEARLEDGAPAPPELPPGSYGFAARAADSDCRWFARGCTQVELPLAQGQSVETVLEPAAEPTPYCEEGEMCLDGRCAAAMDGATDGGGVDAGDAGDAGNELDAGDAGRVVDTLVLECEAGSRFGQMRTVTAGQAASGGAYVDANTSAEDFVWSSDSPQLPPDRVELPVTLAGGDYYLWVRIYGASEAQDQLYAGFAPDSMRSTVPDPDTYAYGEEWTWVGGDDDVSPWRDVPAGEHDFIVGNGEVGARCDKVVLTNDPSYEPSARYEAFRVRETPVIDGDPSDLALGPGAEVAIHETGSRVTYWFRWDDVALYVAARVEDEHLTGMYDAARDERIWNEDSVEILFDTLHDGGSDLQIDDYKFFVNVHGTQTDTQGGDRGWDTMFDSAVRTMGSVNDNADTDDGYEVEMAIPWDDWGVDAPAEGTTWGLDLAFNDLPSADATRQTAPWWNSDLGNVNQPDGFGDLVFQGEP